MATPGIIIELGSGLDSLDVLASLFDPEVASAGDIATVAHILRVDASDLFGRVIDRSGLTDRLFTAALKRPTA